MKYAVTGHRPHKLNYAYPETAMYDKLVCFCIDALAPGVGKIEMMFTGMALGFDMAIAQACIKLDIPFTACVPFKGQESKWPKAGKDYYNELLAKATHQVIVSPGTYSAVKMDIRNRYMVDNADKLIALWDGSSGGTCNCVQYAKIQNKETFHLWNKYMGFIKGE